MKMRYLRLPICLFLVYGIVFAAWRNSDLNEEKRARRTDPLSSEELQAKSKQIRQEKLGESCEKLKVLFTELARPSSGDWLANHFEFGQGSHQYTRQYPREKSEGKNQIYIKKLGAFSSAQESILKLSQEYMHACFSLEVKRTADLALSAIPASARREHPYSGEQVYTKYVLYDVLNKNKPKDAAAYLAFSSADLYPDPDWNFVFGQASLRDRVGVWSIYRNGDPGQGEDAFQLCLRRTIKTAVHETGHIFGLKHCLAYQCVMNGSNSQRESDGREMYFCPSCLQKLTWQVKYPVKKRYEALLEIAKKAKLKKEEQFFIEALGLLK